MVVILPLSNQSSCQAGWPFSCFAKELYSFQKWTVCFQSSSLSQTWAVHEELPPKSLSSSHSNLTSIHILGQAAPLLMECHHMAAPWLCFSQGQAEREHLLSTPAEKSAPSAVAQGCSWEISSPWERKLLRLRGRWKSFRHVKQHHFFQITS